jgi:hypothetical protein
MQHINKADAARMTKAQINAVEALRRDIDRVDRACRGPVAKGRTGRRCFKVWSVTVRLDGTVVVRSAVGWKRDAKRGRPAASHPFDDITRVITVGRRGGLSGWGNVGHGDAGETTECRGPRTLYAIDAQRVY